jgi:hypothetical protein
VIKNLFVDCYIWTSPTTYIRNLPVCLGYQWNYITRSRATKMKRTKSGDNESLNPNVSWTSPLIDSAGLRSSGIGRWHVHRHASVLGARGSTWCVRWGHHAAMPSRGFSTIIRLLDPSTPATAMHTEMNNCRLYNEVIRYLTWKPLFVSVITHLLI